MTVRPPLPPFTEQTARRKVQAAEDAWSARGPHRVALAYTEGSAWRNRSMFITGRDQIVQFLTRKWERELDTPCARNCGPSTATASRYVSSMKAMTRLASGDAATATSCGSSTATGG